MSLRLYIFFTSLFAFVLYTGVASAFDLTGGYPQRINTKRAAPLPGSFDLAASNAGINRADCLDTSQRWRFAFTDVPADTTSIEIWARADAGSCAAASERSGNEAATAPHCFRVATLAAASGELEFDNLSIIQAVDKKKNAEGALDAATVCARKEHMPPTAIYLRVLAFQGSTVVGTEIEYTTLYDLAGPPAPTGMTTGAGEGLVTVKWKAPSPSPTDFAKYQVYCFKGSKPVVADAGAGDGGDGGDGGDAGDAVAVVSDKCPTGHPFVPGALPTSALDAYKCGEHTTVAGEITLDVQVNDIPYAVALAAIDKQDNFGPLSEVVCETPRATNSFWDNYNAAGGQAGGGYCSMGAGSASPIAIALVVLAIVGLCLRRRAVLVAFVPLLLAAPARADDESLVMMEARFGPYRPRVDRVNGRTPFADTFGTAPRLMGGASLEMIPVHIPSFGSIGIGALFGYTSLNAKARYADKSGISEEKTSFDLWLLAAVTTLRVDVIARRTVVPLVPYAKIGLVNAFWSSSDGHGVSTSADGRDARGRTNGFLYGLGAMVLLDVFDPEAAKAFAAERGVKHSYVFGELTVADIRGFGQSYPMHVGDLTFTGGVAFEM